MRETMYELVVTAIGSTIPLERVEVSRAAAVLTVIPTLLAKHEGCDRVEVSLQGTKLFSVDCHGNTTPGRAPRPSDG